MSYPHTETVFEQALRDPSLPKLFESDWHKVAAFADPYPRLPYQSVIVPYRPFGDKERVLGDMQPLEALAVAAVGYALQKKLQRICTPGQLALIHTEGYGVPEHGHTLVYQSYERKSGKELYEGPVLPAESVEQTLADLAFTPAERSTLLWSLDALHRGFTE